MDLSREPPSYNVQTHVCREAADAISCMSIPWLSDRPIMQTEVPLSAGLTFFFLILLALVYYNYYTKR